MCLSFLCFNSTDIGQTHQKGKEQIRKSPERAKNQSKEPGRDAEPKPGCPIVLPQGTTGKVSLSISLLEGDGYTLFFQKAAQKSQHGLCFCASMEKVPPDLVPNNPTAVDTSDYRGELGRQADL